MTVVWGSGGADVDEQSKKEIKDILLAYDRTLLVADPRRCEPKKCAPLAWQSDKQGALLLVSGMQRLLGCMN